MPLTGKLTVCLGIPLTVVRLRSPGQALCRADDNPAELREVDLSLLDQPPVPGDWLLVHVNIAIRALAASEARQIGDALRAVTAAAAGQPFEHLLSDLIDREPQLPPHLQTPAQTVPES